MRVVEVAGLCVDMVQDGNIWWYSKQLIRRFIPFSTCTKYCCEQHQCIYITFRATSRLLFSRRDCDLRLFWTTTRTGPYYSTMYRLWNEHLKTGRKWQTSCHHKRNIQQWDASSTWNCFNVSWRAMSLPLPRRQRRNAVLALVQYYTFKED